MSERLTPCCVPKCNAVTEKRHRFPPQQDLFNVWLTNVNNTRLLKMPSKSVYKYLVCDRHFAESEKVPGTRRGLKFYAVPTLFLPSTCQDVQSGVSTAVSAKEILLEHNYFVEKEKCSSKNHNQDSFVTDSLASECTTSTSSEHTQEPPTPKKICHKDTSSGVTLSKGVRRRSLFLTSVNASRKLDLTPKCRQFHKMISNWSRSSTKLRNRMSSFKERLAVAEQIASSSNFARLSAYVSDTTYKFIMQQVRNQKVCPKARRFSLDEKILSLSIMKSSAPGYRFLSKIFSLPSRRTLTNLLNKLHMTPGVNRHIMDNLKSTTAKMESGDKCCVLLFDEIYIDTHICYRKKEDHIEGIEDLGYTRRRALADYANVFMLKGVRRQWKQPLCFTFSSGPLKSGSLKKLIVELISACQEIDLEVVATICDQGAANVAAINSLLREKDPGHYGFTINGKEIVHLYDVPHLFNGIRNNLLTKDLHFAIDNNQTVTKWKHIEDFYHLDCCDSTRMCVKLTDQHVIKDKINKMKVSHCTQVFSHQVGSLMMRISRWDTNGEGSLGRDSQGTATLILFLDELFDSLNSNNPIAPSTKPFKGGATKTSLHYAYWKRSIRVLETMKFFSSKKGCFVKTPSVQNLIQTLKGFLHLTHTLLDKYEFSYVLLRSFNQDALENFFGCIRSYRRRNVHPTVTHFVSSFKALLVNNFMSSRSPGFNCEADTGEALDNLRYFLTSDDPLGICQLEENSSDIDIPQSISLVKKSRVAQCTVTYIAGYVAKRALNMAGNCGECQNIILYSDCHSHTDFIEARQYQTATFIKPGSFLTFVVSQSLSHLFYLIPRLCDRPNISKVLGHIVSRNVNFLPLKCSKHPELSDKILKQLIRIALFYWCRRVTSIYRSNKTLGL